MIAKILPVIGRYIFWLVFGLAIFAIGDFITGEDTLRRSSLFVIAGITTGFTIGEFIRSRKSKSNKRLA